MINQDDVKGIIETEGKAVPEWALGFNTLLMGTPGSAKTSSLATLLKAGMRVFVAFTEPGIGNLIKACQKIHKLSDEEMSRLHYAYIKPGVQNFLTLSNKAKTVNSAAEFGKIEGGSRAKYNQLVKLMELCMNFKDQNGIEWGPVDAFPPNYVFAIDGLSGLSDMAMDLVVGAKPVKTLQEWGVAIDQLDTFVKQCTNSVCCFVLLSHLEQERDEVTGKTIVTVSALGRKLGTTLGRHFNDVVLCRMEDGKPSWSTSDKNSPLKGSYLAIKERLPADFGPLVSEWKDANGFNA